MSSENTEKLGYLKFFASDFKVSWQWPLNLERKQAEFSYHAANYIQTKSVTFKSWKKKKTSRIVLSCCQSYSNQMKIAVVSIESTEIRIVREMTDLDFKPLQI